MSYLLVYATPYASGVFIPYFEKGRKLFQKDFIQLKFNIFLKIVLKMFINYIFVACHSFVTPVLSDI